MTDGFYIHLEGMKALCALHQSRGLEYSTFVVGVGLCQFMGADGTCWPSREALALRAGIKRAATVSAALTELVAAGFIARERGQRGIRYRLCGNGNRNPGDLERAVPENPGVTESATPKTSGVAENATPENPGGSETATSGGSVSATSASTYMNEYKNECKVAAARPDFPLSRSPDMEAKNEPERTPSPKPKSTLKPKVTWDGERFDIPDVQMALWEAAYPTIDVANEIAKAAAWLVSNGEKKKAFGRFLNGWLGRAKPIRTETAYVASASAEAVWLEIIEQNRRSAANA